MSNRSARAAWTLLVTWFVATLGATPPTDWINIEAFGADPAPGTDDTAAVAAAAASAEGGVLFIPRGVYEIRSAVTLTDVHVRGTMVPDSGVEASSAERVLHGGTEIVFNGSSNCFQLEGSHCVIEDLYLTTLSGGSVGSSSAWFSCQGGAEIDVSFDTVECEGVMPIFCVTNATETNLEVWNCELHVADKGFYFFPSQGVMRISDSRIYPTSADASAAVVADVSGSGVSNLTLSSVSVRRTSEDDEGNPLSSPMEFGVALDITNSGTPATTAEILMAGCRIESSIGVNITPPASANIQMQANSMETQMETLLVDAGEETFSEPLSLVLRGCALSAREGSPGRFVAINGYDGPNAQINISANHFSLASGETRLSPAIEIEGIGEDGGVVNISANIFPEMNANESDGVPAIRLIECDGAVINGNAITGTSIERFAIDLPYSDNVAITGNILAGHGFTASRTANILGDDTSNLFLAGEAATRELDEVLFVANAGGGNVIALDLSSLGALTAPLDRLDLDPVYSRPTSVAVAQRSGTPADPHYVFIADEWTGGIFPGRLWVYTVVQTADSISPEIVDLQPLVPNVDEFQLGNLVSPQGIDVISDPNDSTQYRVYLACRGQVDETASGEYTAFARNYGTTASTRGVVEVLFDPDNATTPCEIRRVFDTPEVEQDDPNWPFSLAVPADVAVYRSGTSGTLAISTRTPQFLSTEPGGETFQAIIQYFDLNDSTYGWSYDGNVPATAGDVIENQGDEIPEIAFSHRLAGAHVWYSGLQNQQAVRRNLGVDANPVVRSFSSGDFVALDVYQTSAGEDEAFFAIATGPGSGKVVRVRPVVGTGLLSNQTVMLMGTESTYAASRMVLLDAPTEEQIVDIFPLHGAPVDIVAVGSTPSTQFPDSPGYVASVSESILEGVPNNILEYLVPEVASSGIVARGWIQVVGLDEPRGLAILPLVQE